MVVCILNDITHAHSHIVVTFPFGEKQIFAFFCVALLCFALLLFALMGFPFISFYFDVLQATGVNAEFKRGAKEDEIETSQSDSTPALRARSKGRRDSQVKATTHQHYGRAARREAAKCDNASREIPAYNTPSAWH